MKLRTQETCRVEEAFQNAGFAHADAYRYNSASIRVRVVDERFAGLSKAKRMDMVGPILDQLQPDTPT